MRKCCMIIMQIYMASETIVVLYYEIHCIKFCYAIAHHELVRL